MDRSDPDAERAAIAALEDALERPSDERSTFLHSLKGLSRAAKRRALELLEADANSSPGLMTGGASLADDNEPVPDQIGAYRILRLIGRGGMGNVYLAERAADDFDLVVAIKLIKRRLITDDMLDRFRRERQILADLNHPNIARLFDGGETNDGVPYFVMEYVDGAPLHKWLKRAGPSLDESLAVFTQICSAVETAHQRLVIHRDLTPPNILITEGGGVKLIDFGIARPDFAVSSPADGTSRSSAWTPGFAPPEQKDGAEATTLSDVFALGKLLKLLIGDDAPEELKAIANKAASLESGARYSSVSALTEDIENYAEIRPVSAMSPSSLYTAQKFVKRQRLAAVALAIVVSAILGTLIFVTQAYRQTELARAEAEANLTDTRELAGTMMFDVFDEVSNRPGNSEARLMLARNAQQYLDELASDPDASIEARLAAGRGFYRLAGATGTFEAGNRGDITQGLAFYQRSLDILTQLYAEAPRDEVALALARSHINLARDKLASFTDPAGAVDHAETARVILSSIAQPSAAELAELGRAERYLGDGLACCNDRVSEGAEAIQRGLERLASAPADFGNDPALRRSLNDLRNLSAGFAIFQIGDAAGIDIFRSVLSDQRKLAAETGMPQDHRLEATVASNLSRLLIRMGRSGDARLVMEPTHERTLAAYQADPQDNDLQRRLAITSLVMARIAAQSGSRKEATMLIEQGIVLAKQSEGGGEADDFPALNYAHRLHEASQAYWANQQVRPACNLIKEALGLYADYADRYELPVTSLRYRLAPLRERKKSCPD